MSNWEKIFIVIEILILVVLKYFKFITIFELLTLLSLIKIKLSLDYIYLKKP